MKWMQYLADGGRENGKEDLIYKHGVKRRSCLDELPYWRVSDMK